MSALRATPEYVAALAAAHNTPQPDDPIPHYINFAELDLMWAASMRDQRP